MQAKTSVAAQAANAGGGSPEAWRIVRAILVKDTDNGIEVERLYPVAELERQEVRAGGRIFLDLQEMGACGWARVLGVEACPPVMETAGRLVTATFQHRRGLIVEVGIEGEPEPIGATAGHPWWSADRQRWVQTKDLRERERLQALDGSTPRVESLALSSEPEPVYNLEVEGDHCYRVGEQGILVHNTSAPCHPCDMATPNQAITLSRGGRSYSAVVDSFMLNGQRQVCRMRRIDGIVLDTNSGVSRMAREAMRATIFGGPPPVYIPSAAQPTNYDAGHLIANQFGGPKKNKGSGVKSALGSGAEWDAFD